MKAVPINIDDNQKSFFSARNMRVQLSSSHSIETPYRALSNSELIAKAQMPSEIALHSEVSGIHNDLSVNDVQQILNDNDVVKKKIRNLENYRQRMQHSSMIFSLLQPCKTARDQVLFTDKQREKYLEITIGMQMLANFDYICVPWVGFEDINSTINQFKKIENSCNRELIFFLDLKSKSGFLDEISKYLIELIDSDRIHAVGVVHHPIVDTLVSHVDLWNSFKEKNAAIIVANVERSDLDYDRLSSIHLSEFILGDIFLPRVMHPFGTKDGGEKGVQKKSKPKIKLNEKFLFFDRTNLTVSPIGAIQNKSWADTIASTIPDPHVRDVINNFSEAEIDREKFQVVSAISKVYEQIVSSKELEISKKFIKSGETDEYVNNKSILSHVLKNTVGSLKKRKTFFS